LSTDGSVTILDLTTDESGERGFAEGKDPDAILYDVSVKRVFHLQWRSSKDATAIDAELAKSLGQAVPLGGKPETAPSSTDGWTRLRQTVEDQNNTHRRLRFE